MKQTIRLLAFLVATLAPAAQAQDDGALVSYQMMKPEIALALAQATMDDCRARGYQVSVTVSDRFGLPQVVLRDRYAGPHTLETSRRKAWTAASFRTDTMAFSELTQAGQDLSGIRHVSQAMAVGGGIPIEAAGTLVGAVGVSGAPGGDLDHACAETGIEAIAVDLEF
jgi:uncharacterized protein GlcG (DUF336 family)